MFPCFNFLWLRLQSSHLAQDPCSYHQSRAPSVHSLCWHWNVGDIMSLLGLNALRTIPKMLSTAHSFHLQFPAHFSNTPFLPCSTLESQWTCSGLQKTTMLFLAQRKSFCSCGPQCPSSCHFLLIPFTRIGINSDFSLHHPCDKTPLISSSKLCVSPMCSQAPHSICLHVTFSHDLTNNLRQEQYLGHHYVPCP